MSNVETIKVVPARYPLRAVGAAVALFVLAVVIQSVAFNPRWEWAVFARWFFDPVILAGLGQTLLLTLLGTVLSVIFGGLLALARLSSSWLLSSLAWSYIWLFRSLPLIVVLMVQVGIPAEGIGLILGVDRFLDMCRTTLNVAGDLVIARLITSSVEQKDIDSIQDEAEQAA